MKLRNILVIVLAIGLIMVTGCTRRNDSILHSSSVPHVGSSASSVPNFTPSVGSTPDLASSAREKMEDFRSEIEEDISDIERNHEENKNNSPHVSGENESSLREELERERSESAAQAMSTDFEQIGALSHEKKSWGPGHNADNLGRPNGATAYQEQYGKHGAYFIAPNSNKIYLTFDEGYDNGFTGEILDTLKAKNVKAVFFITYDFARSSAELVKRMVNEGHILGNHSAKHKSLPDMTIEEIIEDTNRLHEYVKANFGYTMTLYRPPMGEFSEQALAVINSIGYKSVFWSVAYEDWDPEKQPITIEAVNTLVSRAHPGAIYLLHSVSKTNAEILGDVIDAIRAKGFEFTRWDWA